jgi:hypothetical protein
VRQWRHIHELWYWILNARKHAKLFMLASRGAVMSSINLWCRTYIITSYQTSLPVLKRHMTVGLVDLRDEPPAPCTKVRCWVRVNMHQVFCFFNIFPFVINALSGKTVLSTVSLRGEVVCCYFHNIIGHILTTCSRCYRYHLYGVLRVYNISYSELRVVGIAELPALWTYRYTGSTLYM